MSNIPEGWKLVPVEPTKEQKLAVCMHPDLAAALYRSMVAAAPAPADARPVTLPDRMEHGFHPMAHEGFRGGWNSCLDAVNKLGPLYTHPNAGEVERLSAQLESFGEDIGQLKSDLDDAEEERDALQQRLTAADERIDALGSAAKEMLRIAAIVNHGSSAYNRAIVNLHNALNTSKP
ncbi:hypothetical protein HX882_12265 [Pseudomonas gingeri]|uniref:Uncharacterized protein n=1 Tax=Pseudomonas gingeri TaxID=117681 RepID=A0A7Y7XBF2_9PSED|nr:hypothetical protein [Pseudomonas gingeri]NWB96669.1 hypothetical protein [Pseudomonas gingeri]